MPTSGGVGARVSQDHSSVPIQSWASAALARV